MGGSSCHYPREWPSPPCPYGHSRTWSWSYLELDRILAALSTIFAWFIACDRCLDCPLSKCVSSGLQWTWARKNFAFLSVLHWNFKHFLCEKHWIWTLFTDLVFPAWSSFLIGLKVFALFPSHSFRKVLKASREFPNILQKDSRILFVFKEILQHLSARPRHFPAFKKIPRSINPKAFAEVFN